MLRSLVSSYGLIGSQEFHLSIAEGMCQGLFVESMSIRDFPSGRKSTRGSFDVRAFVLAKGLFACHCAQPWQPRRAGIHKGNDTKTVMISALSGSSARTL